MQSRGPTRRESKLSEGQSYANLASDNGYWCLLQTAATDSASPAGRIHAEPRALDSYHNILFSLTLFQTLFAAWPRHITLISHAFKRPRLVANHALGALRWPASRLDFVGIDPPVGEGPQDPGVTEAAATWMGDPHGRGTELRGKREARNPLGSWQGVFPGGMDGGMVQDTGGLVTRGVGADETVDDEARMPWEE